MSKTLLLFPKLHIQAKKKSQAYFGINSSLSNLKSRAIQTGLKVAKISGIGQK